MAATHSEGLRQDLLFEHPTSHGNVYNNDGRCNGEAAGSMI